MGADMVKQIIDLIKKEKQFVVLTHENPDGDAIGSQLAVCHALKKLHKDVMMVCDELPRKYLFLHGCGDMVCSGAARARVKGRVAIFVDTPVIERLGKMEISPDMFASIINIDHHVSNVRFGDLNWIDRTASSVGEMIFCLIERLGIRVEADIASALYVAILTDTGMFQYANTTRKTHAVVGELLESGIDQFSIYQNVYENVPLAKLKLLSEGLNTIQTDCGGRLVYMWVTQDMLRRTGATLELTEDIINFARSVEGCVVAVVVKETQERNVYRVSLRSKSKKVDVNKIAAQFDGGGHKAAAGCTIRGRKDDVKKRLIAAIKKELKKDS